MGKYLNIGNAGFRSMTKDIYVDKTDMIRFINSTLGTRRKLTCVSRLHITLFISMASAVEHVVTDINDLVVKELRQAYPDK